MAFFYVFLFFCLFFPYFLPLFNLFSFMQRALIIPSFIKAARITPGHDTTNYVNQSRTIVGHFIFQKICATFSFALRKTMEKGLEYKPNTLLTPRVLALT
jgi:hypothetical protein